MPDKLFEESMNRWNKQYQEFLEKQAKAHIPPKAREAYVTMSDNIGTGRWTPTTSPEEIPGAAPSDSEYISNESKPKRNLVDWYGD